VRGTIKSSRPIQRIRITFSMDPMLRFVSHLDMVKAWERTFRRADLPMAFSQGFHPQPKMQFAAALPVGIWGEAELLDLWLVEKMHVGGFRGLVEPVLPPGLRLEDVRDVPMDEPALQVSLLFGVYEAVVGGIGREEVEHLVEEFLARDRIVYTRRTRKKTKDVDIRPLVERLEAFEKGGSVGIRMTLSHRAGASVRAFDVLDVMGIDIFSTRVVRKGLVLSE